MRKFWIAALLLAVCVAVSACYTAPDTTLPADVSVPTAPAAPTTIPPTVPATIPPETTQPPILTGWQEIDGKRCFYLMDGTLATGWVEILGLRYYFDADGALHTGWLQQLEGLYYLDDEGVMATGWQTLEGKHYCFSERGLMHTGWQAGADGIARYLLSDGSMAVGWTQIDQNRYYFDAEGLAQTGWIEVEGKRYYLEENGVAATGWLEQDGRLYYLREDGAMARGCVEIDGNQHYFTSYGDHILLVNPWNYVPEGYDPELVTIRSFGAYLDMLIAEICSEPLQQMLSDCKAAGYKTYVVSSYRTQEFQEKNFQRKVDYYLNLGYGEEEARTLAAKVVAVPGTSEHQLGLAVDVVDASWPYLEEEQANQPAQKWLMEHCWEYGFILRYPKGKTDVTGIIYEPWHYRYVGKELAAELHACGLTLEEYMQQLTQEEAET